MTVVQLDPAVPLDRFADHLDGVDVRVVRAYAGEHPGPADRLEGLVVLGGNMSAHDEHEPGIPETRALLADAVRAGGRRGRRRGHGGAGGRGGGLGLVLRHDDPFVRVR